MLLYITIYLLDINNKFNNNRKKDISIKENVSMSSVGGIVACN